MDKYIIKRTSFSEICKLLEGNESDIGKCITGVFEIALLFLPGLVCKNVTFITNAVNGATLLGAKPIIENAIKNITNIFTKNKYDDFLTKYEHAQIAQVLIVYTAYFDAVKDYLPDEEKNIRISPKEKIAITEESLSKYLRDIQRNISKDVEKEAKDILDYDLPLPNPVNSMEEYVRNLKKFYNILNDQLMKFYTALDFFDSMDGVKKDRFVATICELPDRAVENYEKQYYQLSVTFHDFFVWTNIEEHKKIQKRLDIGFEKISKCIFEYCEKNAHSKAVTTLEYYKENYNAYIETSVVEASEMKDNFADEIIFPSKREIFVPQSFRTLIYRNDMHLEDRAVWKRLNEREDIGKFVGDILRHSVNGSLPLLILGHPGAGKSLLCNMLAAQILCHEYHVIIVKLRDSNAEQTIMQQINGQIERDFSNGCRWNELVESRLNKQLLIIFDGYDELLQASGKAYSDYLQKIVEFQESQKIHGIFVKCIVTSRITLIDKAEITRNTPVIMLSDFDEERIGQWSNVWNKKNQGYFAQEGLKKFSISRSDRVFELAKQPLLLLMLALYDSNGNALKRNKNMSETQLYDNLIREFILREKRKDEVFRSLQKDRRDKLVAQEMIKISIAALGMYNRKKLYIRSEELEKDLEFILRKKKENNDNLKYSELSESEKLVGSFFFIHKSSATDVVNRERISNTAYEFLHNTFGEFLTANYMVTEMKNVISWIHTLLEAKKEELWKLGSQRAWIAGMAYTPLFSRPVVIRMVKDWVSGYFLDQNREEINAGLNTLLNFEIPNIISGNVIFDLKEVMEEKENPYIHVELLKHIAIYSVNLMILRTIIFGSEYRFKFDDEIWNKIFSIWRYAFSEDELLSFSNQFTIDKNDKEYVMKYIEEKNVLLQKRQSKIAKYMQINSVVGNSALYGIMGALTGENNMDEVMNAIDSNQLNINARYLWNVSLNELFRHWYSPSDLQDIIFYMNKKSWEERDMPYILCGSMLFTMLLKNKIIKKNIYEYNIEVIRNLLRYIVNYGFKNNENVLQLLLHITLDLLDYVQMDADNFSRLIECIQLRYDNLENENAYYALRVMLKAMEKIPIGERKKNRNTQILNDYIRKYMEQMIFYARRGYKLTQETIDCMENIDNYMRIQNDEYMADIYYSMIGKLISEYYEKKERSFSKNVMLIKSIYILFRRTNKISIAIQEVLNEMFQKMDLKMLYKEEPMIFGDLLTMINEGVLNTISEQTIHDILYIVKHKEHQLSVRNYRMIYKLAENMNCNELKILLDQLLK